MKISSPTPSQIPGLRELWKESFGDTDKFLDIFFSVAFGYDRCRCISVDDDVAAALYWFDCTYSYRPIAYIYAVATADRYRGQGMCKKLMADTHEYLRAKGYEGTVLVPGSEGLFGMYEKLGYEICSYINTIRCERTDENILIRSLCKEEYANLRRSFLPEGGVIQEDENLDFLEHQANFYAGEGFILAARGHKESLYGIELLGETKKAGAIVNSLGYKNGVFRTPGKDTAFAMYFPLTDSEITPPSYLGFAFD